MKYILIIHQNCDTGNEDPYGKMSKGDFIIAIGEEVDVPEDRYTDESGNLDEAAYDAEWYRAFDELVAKAESEDGLNCGNYSLYIRNDDFDMYSIARKKC